MNKHNESIVNNLSFSEARKFLLKLQSIEKGNIVEVKEVKEEILSKIIKVKSTHLGAKAVCIKCLTPIFEIGGECPNCEN